MNTLGLVPSGTTVTWVYNCAIGQNDQCGTVNSLGCVPMFLGIAFVTFEAYEYRHVGFKLTDGYIM